MWRVSAGIEGKGKIKPPHLHLLSQVASTEAEFDLLQLRCGSAGMLVRCLNAAGDSLTAASTGHLSPCNWLAHGTNMDESVWMEGSVGCEHSTALISWRFS
ncbi:hypothetical protein ANANG_G00245060 [Anguilla anguilla]|uniref:Uncharacterized protein n=1 Tax=Anguilla anguilla TaxID=7936 RepID=A0A9D3LS88_ANGAN|nr:hypothetical protein ANANG_G00245060 [Anguilla anguilla]